MALIIEDGTIVANANSYITDAEFTAYSDARGYSYPVAVAAREALIIKANDYIQSVEKRMQGTRTSAATQALAFPRQGVYLYCTLLASDSIPQTLKNAQCEAAIALNEGNSLLVTTTSGNIASEKVGELEVSYHSGGSFEQVRTETIDTYLDPLLKSNGQGNQMSRF